VEELCAGLIAREQEGTIVKQNDGKQTNLFETIQANPYPGRGILLGLTPDRTRAALAYFIMGRSAGSRSRAFAKDGDNLAIRMLDDGKIADTSLIFYMPLRTLAHAVVVTNGDQTETICASLAEGKTFEDALQTRSFEPDAPHFTPRISGMLDFSDGFSYKLSILKAGDTQGKTTLRQTFAYEPLAGTGHLIHTYAGDGKTLPSFAGEPVAVEISDDCAAFAQALWNALNPENRVSLYVRFTNLQTNEIEDRLFNQYETQGDPA
jgi:IMP cyclohydrolase